MKKNLLKEAIADARSLKEAAITNAKLALEEAFTPRIKEMLSTKIQEMENEDELDENQTLEGYNEDGNVNENPLDEDLSLDEILAELEDAELDEAREKTDINDDDDESFDSSMDEEIDLDALLAEEFSELDEAEDKDDDDDDKESKPKAKSPAKPKAPAKPKSPAEPKVDTKDNDDEGDEEVAEMTIDELKDLIRAVMNGEEDGAGEEQGEEEEMDILNLNEMFDDEMNEGTDPRLQSAISGATEIAKMLDKGIDYIKGEGKDRVKKAVAELNKALANIGIAAGSAMRNFEEDTLAEVEQLKTELNETNLLYSKSLYANKIFRNNTLNESQKVKVINSFDKAKNVKEAKLIFETIKDSFSSIRKPIKESYGFASKSTGGSSTGKDKIIENTDATVARWQKLAGIKK